METSREFEPFPKIARLFREVVITEKIDGTNAHVLIAVEPKIAEDFRQGRNPFLVIAEEADLVMFAGSRTRYITPEQDNHGFARWAKEHAAELFKLGPGRHFGEWWGSGIQRGYGLPKGEKRFSLFNTARWHLNGTEPHVWKSVPSDKKGIEFSATLSEELPACVGLVPVLHQGHFSTGLVETCARNLREGGSVAAPGFRNPEGLVVYHTAANLCLKMTLEKDDEPKGKQV